MAKSKLFLDTRRLYTNGEAMLKIAVRNKNSTAYIPTEIRLFPTQWDGSGIVINHPMKSKLNARIARKKSEIDLAIFDIQATQNISSLSATALKEMILKKINPDLSNKESDSFVSYFNKFIELKKGRTRELYEITLKRISEFETNISNLNFEDITPEWLTLFNDALAKKSPSINARNIHLRNIRAIFNSAIEDEVTSFYPFRKFKIKEAETHKRSLDVEQLRYIFSFKPEPYMEIYIDAFKLIFLLCGINIIDLCNLKGIVDGRIIYHRAKTHKLYSIKVEPEAAELIEKYKGTDYLLCYLERFKSYKDFAKYLNKNLKHIGEYERKGRGGKKIYKSVFPNISSYWARHSWATIAADIDIPDAVIAQGLGHGNVSKITEKYIHRNEKKVDKANRKIIDWVLYNKI